MLCLKHINRVISLPCQHLLTTFQFDETQDRETEKDKNVLFIFHHFITVPELKTPRVPGLCLPLQHNILSLDLTYQAPDLSTFMCSVAQLWLFETLWSVAHQAPLSMKFSRGCHFLLQLTFIALHKDITFVPIQARGEF